MREGRGKEEEGGEVKRGGAVRLGGAKRGGKREVRLGRTRKGEEGGRWGG